MPRHPPKGTAMQNENVSAVHCQFHLLNRWQRVLVTEWIPGSSLRFASLRPRMTKSWRLALLRSALVLCRHTHLWHPQYCMLLFVRPRWVGRFRISLVL